MKLFIFNRAAALTGAVNTGYACHTTSISGQTAPDRLAVFLRPKFNYGRDDRPKYKTFGEYASRLIAVVESRLPVTSWKVYKLNDQEAVMPKSNRAPLALSVFNYQFSFISLPGLALRGGL